MGRFWLFFFIADIIIMAAALISCLSAEEHEIKSLPRLLWIVIILLFSPVGGIVWFVAGKNRPHRTGYGPTPLPGRPVAPDDDPDFLRKLREQREEERRRKREEPDDSSDS